jgi:hypothetical protein
MTYGAAGQVATVHDTTFFYAAPLSYLLALFAGLFALSLGVVFWWRRSLVPDYGTEESDGPVTLSVRLGTSRDEQDHDIRLTPPPRS